MSWKRQVIQWVPPVVMEFYRRHRLNPPPHLRPDAQFLLPKRSLAELFPLAPGVAQVPLNQVARDDHWMVPAAELLTLAALCASWQPRRIFEIGTYTGSSTLIMALNSPADAQITTIDLEPTSRDDHVHGLGVGGYHQFTVGQAFLDTPQAAQITQLYGDSRRFDFRPYHGQCDLVFVDADHTYEFVKHDSAIAFQLIRPGGVIVWDDYIWTPQHPECAGVTRCLNELSQRLPIYQLRGTRFGIYRDGVAP